MNKVCLKKVALLAVLCIVTSGAALASMRAPVLIGRSTHVDLNDPTTNVPFPTAGDAYCSFTHGCGTIPSGGQTAYQWTAGDFVNSAVFTNILTNSVTDITVSWGFQDFMNGYNEVWGVFINNTEVAAATIFDCGGCGTYGTLTGTVSFADIAPLNGGYQVSIVLSNTIPSGGGSVAWTDGGITGLSYGAATPEPGSLMLFGSGMVGLAGLLRRKLS